MKKNDLFPKSKKNKSILFANAWIAPEADEQNDARAQYNLGACYANGEGVEKNIVEAYAYLNLASKADLNAGRIRDGLEKRMTFWQIADGQERTKELRAKIEAKMKSRKHLP